MTPSSEQLESFLERLKELERELAKLKELVYTLVDMIDRLPGKIGFGKPPAS